MATNPTVGQEPWGQALNTRLDDIDGKAALDHTHPASDISSEALPVSHGGTGLSSGPAGNYLQFGNGNVALGTISPLAVRTDIGAAEEVTTPIGWTSFSTQSPVTNADRARARRHATGLVEVQLSVDVSGLSTGDVVTNDLPSWVIPTDGHPLSLAPAVNASATGVVAVNITTASEVKVFAANPGSVNFVRFVAVYTP